MHAVSAGQSASREHIGAHTPSVVTGPIATAVKNRLRHRWLAPRVMHAASPTGPSWQPSVQRPPEHTPEAQPLALVHVAPKAPVPGGATHRKHPRERMAVPASVTPASAPPLQVNSPLHAWPAMQSELRVHSPVSRAAGARQVIASQYPPPKHARPRQHGWPGIPQLIGGMWASGEAPSVGVAGTSVAGPRSPAWGVSVAVPASVATPVSIVVASVGEPVSPAVPLSGVAVTQRAVAPEPSQVSPVPHAGLHALTHVPEGEHTVPDRHAGKHITPLTPGLSLLQPASAEAANIHAKTHRDRTRLLITTGYHGCGWRGHRGGLLVSREERR